MIESLKDTLEEGSLEDMLTIVYYYVDEFYQKVGFLVDRPGPQAVFSDSEVITMALVNQMVTNSETAWYDFIKRNYSHLFPQLIERSRFHRRSKGLFKLTNLMRQMMLCQLGITRQLWYIMDSMPLPVCGYSRAGRQHNLAAEFGITHQEMYGYCAAKDLAFYGFRLHLMVTTDGVIAHFVLAPASHHDVTVAPELLETYRHQIIVGADKGYVGLHKRLTNEADYQLVIQRRDNQLPNTVEERLFLARFRKIIETTNSQLSEQFQMQYCRAKSAWGLMNRVVNKLTAHTLAIFLNALAERPLLNIKSLIF
jgi:hypothetical protein